MKTHENGFFILQIHHSILSSKCIILEQIGLLKAKEKSAVALL